MKTIKPQKVTLYEMAQNFKKPVNLNRAVVAQINPETLRIGRVNGIAQLPQTGAQGTALVTSETETLSVALCFDLTASAPELPQGIADVRELTAKVAYFVAPLAAVNKQSLPRPIRFQWGKFKFDGYMQSMVQTLDCFLANGKPLRAIVAFTIVSRESAGQSGTSPVGPIQAATGESLQGLAGASGGRGDWQSVAAGNSIENPRRLAPGQPL